ncbi:MAG: hypothetical protein JXA69_14090 [Phycisphaerae bacterium]|nr:hypothetical protein [Phycisphaerae bacterium]
MKPSQAHDNDCRPQPMRTGRFKRLLLGTTGLVIATTGSQCQLVDQEHYVTLGDIPSAHAMWWADQANGWSVPYGD